MAVEASLQGNFGGIATARGRTGGSKLARPPEDINFGDVMRQMEDGFDLTGCMRRAITPSCRPKGSVGRALETFLAVFDGLTLAEIAGNRKELPQLLVSKGTSGKDAPPELAAGGE